MRLIEPIKACGHPPASYPAEHFTCNKLSCPYPWKSNGEIWNEEDVVKQLKFVEEGQALYDPEDKLGSRISRSRRRNS